MSGTIVEGGRDLVFRARLELGQRIAGAALAVIGAAIALQLVRAIVANRASTHADWGAYLPSCCCSAPWRWRFCCPAR